ncbi:hypothetical protein HanIR_Chr04g0179901 [Helianthus annuus]|nr:hypothetical protein HanIR_Chr04g0179901 [Helianthus annuus]
MLMTIRLVRSRVSRFGQSWSKAVNSKSTTSVQVNRLRIRLSFGFVDSVKPSQLGQPS